MSGLIKYLAQSKPPLSGKHFIHIHPINSHNTLGSRYHHYPHFTYVETKTQGVYVTSLKSQVFEHIPGAPHHDTAQNTP